MISASVGALAGVVTVFLVFAVLLALPAVFLARTKNASVAQSAAAAVFFAGALAVTLTPGNVGDAATNLECITGTSLRGSLETTQGQLNALLFLPACFFLVISTRRPLVSLAIISVTVPGVELAQAAFPLGRTCTYSDITLNCVGAAIGFTAGLVVVWAKSRKSPFSRRDFRLGGVAAGSALLVMFALFQGAVTPVEGASEALGVTSAQDRWAREAAAGVFGEHTRVAQVQLRPATPDEPVVIDVTTDAGFLNLSWTARKILAADSFERQDDGGMLSSAQAKAVGERFAKRWFAEEVKNSEVAWDPLGGGNGPYSLSYRRYRNGVLMPMRLDITVTSSGRIMAITVRSMKDPDLPKPVLDREEAQRRAEGLTKMKAMGESFLLAERVNGVWRPLWLVNVGENGEAREAPRIDAITGERVQPDPVMEQGVPSDS
ncbi:VanZ family protein [Streptomyces triticisoli]|uniref:VanZ family protein n=1 Tax=Streptomyces triticisoli TaxID=2182797 RepID=UPI000DD698C2|nr:VanZ family protein [Streptomyces triticisoli]